MAWREMKRVGIIGAGVAGLATAKTLLANGLACTIFERGDKLGGVWANGYSNFGVQVQKELYEFPDWPLPSDAPNFTPGPIFQQYLEEYADFFHLRSHIRLRSRITKLTPQGGGTAGWTFSIEQDGTTYEQDFDLAVVATGLYSNSPNLPRVRGQEDFAGDIPHVSDVKTRAPLAGKRVAVVGYGKSATDIALEAAEVAKTVHLIFRDAHWPVPRMLAGILPWKWGMLSRLTGVLIPPYLRPTPIVRWINRLGRPLVWIFWRLVELLLYFQCRLGTKIAQGQNLVPSKPVEIDAFGESTMIPRPELYKLIRQGRITAHRTEIAAFTRDGVILRDGNTLGLDFVVFGTGWRNEYSFLSADVRDVLGKEDDDGFYLYRHMLHPDLPNLIFIGRTATYLNILTDCLQARWLANWLLGAFTFLPAKPCWRRSHS